MSAIRKVAYYLGWFLWIGSLIVLGWGLVFSIYAAVESLPADDYVLNTIIVEVLCLVAAFIGAGLFTIFDQR